MKSFRALQDIFSQGKDALNDMRGGKSGDASKKVSPSQLVESLQTEEYVGNDMETDDFSHSFSGDVVDLTHYHENSSIIPQMNPDGTIRSGQIEQFSPKAKMAPGADKIEVTQVNRNKTVFERVCDEWVKIANPVTGFEYFCQKYVYISNQKHGYINFKLYDYQKRLVKMIQGNRYVITRKFRQAGASLLTGVYCLWYSLTHPRMQCMIVSIGLRESSKYLQENVREIYEALPRWLKGGLKRDPYIYDSTNAKTRKQVAVDVTKIDPIKWTRDKAPKDAATEMMLPNKSKIRSVPTGKAGGRGFATKLLIIDEAAFIENIEGFYVGAYPTINSSGGSVFVISTVNGVGGIGGWYYNTYKKAESGENKFQIAQMSYEEHPDYNDPEWVEDTKANLGDRGWRQEVLGEFLASGNTYIDGDVIHRMDESTVEPIRKEYMQRLWIWEDPIPGHHYGLSADCATKGGLDYSAFHVTDYDTGRQVAEFVGKLDENEYSRIIAEVGYRYGTALVTPEMNAKAGGAVVTSLDKLQRYKRLYRQENGEVGWNTNVRTRDTMFSYLERVLENCEYTIRSSRMVDELKTLIVTKTGRIEADKGAHDDLVMAFCIAIVPEVVRACMRHRPVIPVGLTTSGADSHEGFTGTVKPVYSDEDEKAQARRRREGMISQISGGDKIAAVREVNDLAGEDVLSWLLS